MRFERFAFRPKIVYLQCSQERGENQIGLRFTIDLLSGAVLRSESPAVKCTDARKTLLRESILKWQ